MMGIATHLNKKIKNLVTFPFWCLIPPANKNRLYFHIIDKINSFIVRSGKDIQSVPYKFLIYVSQKTYRRIEKKKETLIFCLKKEIEEYFLFLGCQLRNEEIVIDFSPLSYLKDYEVKLLCFSPNEEDTFIKEKSYYLRLLSEEDKMWIIDRPGEYEIGRKMEAYIHIDNPYVSGCHAKLVLSTSDDIKILDCKSKNGTYLSDDLIPVKDGAYIVPGDKIYLGRKRAVVLELVKM